MTDDGKCTCPQTRQLKGRPKNLNRSWSGANWKQQKAVFLTKNPLCAMHNQIGISVPATVPHHPYRDSYKGAYTDLELSACVAYCKSCHFAIHHGLTLCKVCGEHYHPWDAEMCRFCFDKKHPEIVEAREILIEQKKMAAKEIKDTRNAKNRALKKKHPCFFHHIGGRCGKSVLGIRCPYAPTKAAKLCRDGFKAKKGK